MTVPGGDSGEKPRGGPDQPSQPGQTQPGPPPGYPPPYPPTTPQYGAPPPGYSQPYPGDYPDHAGGYGQQPGTNTLAISSLVASCLGLFCFIGGIIGIVLGSMALSQIKQRREGGYGLAVSGIVIGAAVVVIYLVVVAVRLY